MIKFIKFCAVGASNTLISLAAFYFLNKILNINYVLSTIASYSCGVINSYILNRKFTFKDSERRIIFQFGKFAVVNLISLGANLVLMYIFVDIFYFDSMLSQIICTVFTTLLNYTGSRLMVFKSTF